MNAHGIGFGKLTAGVDFAEKDIGNCACACLTAEVGIKDSTCLICPGKLHG